VIHLRASEPALGGCWKSPLPHQYGCSWIASPFYRKERLDRERIGRLQSATNCLSAAAAALLLIRGGGSRSRSEIESAGAINLLLGCGFILSAGAAAQNSSRNSDPICLTIRSSGDTPTARSVPAICFSPSVRDLSSAAPSNGRRRNGCTERTTKRFNGPIPNWEVGFRGMPKNDVSLDRSEVPRGSSEICPCRRCVGRVASPRRPGLSRAPKKSAGL